MPGEKALPLNRLYRELNLKWFGGKLRPRRVRYATWNGHRAAFQGLCTTRAIYIARALSHEETIGVLLNEMCHIGVRGHGRLFMQKMERLREHGASVLAIEFQERVEPLTASEALAGHIDDLASEAPDLSWDSARRMLAREMLCTPVDFDKSFPWAQRRYRRQVALCTSLKRV